MAFRSRPTTRRAGFTVIEVLMAAGIAMVLMFGALWSTGDAFEVAREGDRRVHTHIHARRSMDRILKDIRYCSSLTITGDPQTGWTIEVVTTGSLDPGLITYNWDPGSRKLRVTDGELDDRVLENLNEFLLESETVDTQNGPEVARVTFRWEMDVDAGFEAGLGAKEYSLTMGGSTWVRKHAPQF